MFKVQYVAFSEAHYQGFFSGVSDFLPSLIDEWFQSVIKLDSIHLVSTLSKLITGLFSLGSLVFFPLSLITVSVTD